MATDPLLPLSSLSVAVVGATGVVGKVALDLLAERGHPAERLIALASSRSAGRELAYGDTTLAAREATVEALAEADVAFISVSAAVSRELAPPAVKRGVLVIDDGSAFRMDEAVPLVIPEVNGAAVMRHRGIISIPNCTTTPLVMVLAALRQQRQIRSVNVATYQAVSGAGGAAHQALLQQLGDSLASGQSPDQHQRPRPFAFNLLPQIGDFDAAGVTSEEQKIERETRKILQQVDLPVTATAVRVPVAVGHSEVVHIELDRELEPAAARDLLAAFPGIVVQDDPRHGEFPTPLDAAGRDEVLVGRIRKDPTRAAGLVLWLVCDNLRKGAALNALQIADECLRRDCLKPR